MIYVFLSQFSMLYFQLQVTNVTEVLGMGRKTPMAIFLDEFGIEPEIKYM